MTTFLGNAALIDLKIHIHHHLKSNVLVTVKTTSDIFKALSNKKLQCLDLQFITGEMENHLVDDVGDLKKAFKV